MITLADLRTASSRARALGHVGVWMRVWSKVDRTNLSGCWRWTGALSQKRRSRNRENRRPVVQLGGRGTPVVSVARLVCRWFHGEPPTPDHVAGHTCPDGECAVCIHPLHLAWMTKEENEAQKRVYGTKVAEVPAVPPSARDTRDGPSDGHTE